MAGVNVSHQFLTGSYQVPWQLSCVTDTSRQSCQKFPLNLSAQRVIFEAHHGKSSDLRPLGFKAVKQSILSACEANAEVILSSYSVELFVVLLGVVK